MHEKAHLIPLLLLLNLILMHPAVQAQEDALLEPDQAFRISGNSDGADGLILQWDIADGYYMYRSKFRFLSETPGVEAGSPDLPAGKIKHDEFFGDMEIYRNKVSIHLPIKRGNDSGKRLNLKATSQGCADQGICYPPHTQTLLLALTEPPVSSPTERSPQGGKSDPSVLDALIQLGKNMGLEDNDDELLPADQAFRFDAWVEDGTSLRLHWTVAPEFYMYKDKIKLSLEEAQGVAIGSIDLPPGEPKADEFFGTTEVYHGDLDVLLPLQRTVKQASVITLKAGYQGCAERGICYPPITKEVKLSLPGIKDVSAVTLAPSGPTAATPIEAPVSELERISATLAQGNIWLILATFFGVGLVLAFTPCIFPMIPILSGIIVGHGTNITPSKAFILSLVYVLAMAVTYTVAGVLAGLFGGNLQAAFQNPWILGFFALVFVLLALSMFGFYELQIPSQLQSRLTAISNRQHGGHLAGVAIMGFLSALIVGPCVAPPLAGALVYIGHTGDAVLGGLALFALSIGMGAPLLAIGTSAGKLLPKAGPWMDAVKAVFGVGLLAVAIIMLERIVPEQVAMLLWASLLIVSAIYMGALRSLTEESSGWPKLWKGLGVVLLTYGGLMLVGVAAGGKDTLQPLRGIGFLASGEKQSHLNFLRIKTVDDLSNAVATASAQDKPVMLDFYADWCVSCKEMEKYTFSEPAVAQALENFVLLQADVTANDEQDQALLQGHFGLPGPPSIMFYDSNGLELKRYRVVGYMAAEEFANHIKRAIQ